MLGRQSHCLSARRCLKRAIAGRSSGPLRGSATGAITLHVGLPGAGDDDGVIGRQARGTREVGVGDGRLG